MQLFDRFIIDGKGIAAADVARGLVMDGLQAKLHPHGLDGGQFADERKNTVRQAVRPCGDGERHDIAWFDGREKQRPQPGCGRIGVRELLKIGDIAGVLPLLAENKFCLLELFWDRGAARGGKFAAARAEDAPARAKRAVAVGAGTAGRERELVDLAAKALAQVRTQRTVHKMPPIKISRRIRGGCRDYACSSSACGARPAITASNCSRLMVSFSSRNCVMQSSLAPFSFKISSQR